MFVNLKDELKKQINITSQSIKRPKRYPDIIYTVELSQEECFYGCKKEIIVEGIKGDPNDTIEKLELKKYTLDISSGTKNNDILRFQGEGCQPFDKNFNVAGDLIFKIKIYSCNGSQRILDSLISSSESPLPTTVPIDVMTNYTDVMTNYTDVMTNYIKVNGYDVEVEVKVDILKIILGGYFKVRYFKEEFEIHTSDFPDQIIEEGKEYKLANLGGKKEDGSKGILTLKIKYDYEEIKKVSESKKEKIKDILEI